MKGTQSKLQAIKVRSLREVMSYENLDVVDRFMQSWELSKEESIQVFDEMKKWLWLCAFSKKQEFEGVKVPNLAISNSMTLLDEMWHAFILFTKQYTNFCTKYFGFYIHHGPTTGSEKEEIKKQLEKDSEGYLKMMEQNLTFQYEYIYDHLGEDTLQKWYSEWTDLYTSEYLNSIYKKQW